MQKTKRRELSLSPHSGGDRGLLLAGSSQPRDNLVNDCCCPKAAKQPERIFLFMTASKIAVFAVLLFIFRNAVGALVVLVLGTEEPKTMIVAQITIGAAINICVFSYMSWKHPAKPILSASVVGISAYILGVLATALIAGSVLLDPITLLFDAPILIVTVLVGVGLGSIFRRRSTAS